MMQSNFDFVRVRVCVSAGSRVRVCLFLCIYILRESENLLRQFFAATFLFSAKLFFSTIQSFCVANIVILFASFCDA